MGLEKAWRGWTLRLEGALGSMSLMWRSEGPPSRSTGGAGWA